MPHAPSVSCALPTMIALRSLALILLGAASLAITPAAVREHNQFHWAPIVEVAKLFAAIFVTIFPVLAILEAGSPPGPLTERLLQAGHGTGKIMVAQPERRAVRQHCGHDLQDVTGMPVPGEVLEQQRIHCDLGPHRLQPAPLARNATL